MTTVGEKGQVVIPSEARKAMKLKKGDKLLVFGMGRDLLAFSRLDNLERLAEHLEYKLSSIRTILNKDEDTITPPHMPTYNTLASEQAIRNVTDALTKRGITVHHVPTKEAALDTLQKLIPQDASVMTGSSTTLEQIGFVDLLKSGKHPWKNLKDAIVAEKDPAKQNMLRKQSSMADYFLGSVHAITEEGQLLIASNTGSQLPAYAYSAEHVIWVAGTQKIVPTHNDAFRRLHDDVFPREDQRMKGLGAPGSVINKILIIEGESPFNARTLHLVLVDEVLGF